jgi:hypothetical protein
MSGTKAKQIELGVDVGASTVLAGAVTLALARLGTTLTAACAAAAASLFIALLGLRRVKADEPNFPLSEFVIEQPGFEEPEELILTDADRLMPAEELLLDDVLTKLGADSRVVRLFDASAMPTPGQLQSKIDEHLSRGTLPDASQALHEALAELRRSLR